MRYVPFAGEWQLDLEEIRGERSPDLARDHLVGIKTRA
jgi:hypothetical protein